MELKLFTRKKNKVSVKHEVTAICQMLIPVNTFKAFCRNNEVFDMNKQKRITNKTRLFNMYAHGIDSFIFVINKN